MLRFRNLIFVALGAEVRSRIGQISKEDWTWFPAIRLVGSQWKRPSIAGQHAFCYCPRGCTSVHLSHEFTASVHGACTPRKLYPNAAADLTQWADACMCQYERLAQALLDENRSRQQESLTAQGLSNGLRDVKSSAAIGLKLQARGFNQEYFLTEDSRQLSTSSSWWPSLD